MSEPSEKTIQVSARIPVELAERLRRETRERIHETPSFQAAPSQTDVMIEAIERLLASAEKKREKGRSAS